MPRGLWVLFAACIVNRMGTMVLPFLMLYLTRALHFSAAEAGLIVGLYGVGSILMGPISGWLCDRWGALRVMLTSLISSTIVMLLFPYAMTFWSVAFVTLLLSFATEVYRPATMVVTSEFVAPEHRRQAFAMIRLAINIGMSFGPALGGILAQYSFHSLFYVNSGTMAATGLMLWYFFFFRRIASPEKPNPEATLEAEGLLASFKGAWSDPKLRYFAIWLLPVIMVFFQHESTLPLITVKEMGLSEAFFGFLFTINTVLIIMFELPLISAISKWPVARPLFWGSVLIAAGFTAIAGAKSQIGVIATVVIWTVGEMVMVPASAAYVADISPGKRKGAYMGLYSMVWSVGMVLGPWVGTFLWEKFGTFWLCMFCLGIGMFSAVMLRRIKD